MNVAQSMAGACEMKQEERRKYFLSCLACRLLRNDKKGNEGRQNDRTTRFCTRKRGTSGVAQENLESAGRARVRKVIAKRNRILHNQGSSCI